MSMSKNIARLAVTAGLTAALSFGGVMAPVTWRLLLRILAHLAIPSPSIRTKTMVM